MNVPLRLPDFLATVRMMSLAMDMSAAIASSDGTDDSCTHRSVSGHWSVPTSISMSSSVSATDLLPRFCGVVERLPSLSDDEGIRVIPFLLVVVRPTWLTESIVDTRVTTDPEEEFFALVPSPLSSAEL